MNVMKLAVLLLQNSDLPRATIYTREWAHQMVGHTTGFLTEQSGLPPGKWSSLK
jgi:hypothetical protein